MNSNTDQVAAVAAATDAKPANDNSQQNARDLLTDDYLLHNPQELRRIFNKYEKVVDINRDGHWTFDEIKAASAKPNQPQELKQALAVFAAGYDVFNSAGGGLQKDYGFQWNVRSVEGISDVDLAVVDRTFDPKAESPFDDAQTQDFRMTGILIGGLMGAVYGAELGPVGAVAGGIAGGVAAGLAGTGFGHLFSMGPPDPEYTFESVTYNNFVQAFDADAKSHGAPSPTPLPLERPYEGDVMEFIDATALRKPSVEKCPSDQTQACLVFHPSH